MAQPSSKVGGYLLGLVPVGVGLVLGTLCLPRVVPPDDVPGPVPDARALARVHATDHAMATEPKLLADDVRALGTAIRTFNSRAAKQGIDTDVTPAAMNDARVGIDQALGRLSGPQTGAPPAQGSPDDALLALRATQLEGFVAAVRTFEKTGVESTELDALGGLFVRRMSDVGWCHEHTCVFDDDALRVMFKLEWDALLRLERPPFEPTRDEQRALFAFYLRHPHAPEGIRKRIDEARAGAHSAKACAALVEAEQLAADQWRLDKVKRLAALDPDFPAAFATGIVQYRHKEYGAAAESFRDWLQAHPDGPWTLRARNYLRASLAESGLE